MGRRSKAKGGGGAREDPLSRNQRRELNDLAGQLIEICSAPPQQGGKEWEELLKIYDIVGRICTIQKDLTMPRFSRAENIESFRAWLGSNGVDTSNVDIASESSAEYGLRAANDIKEGETVLKIPRTLLMSTETARASALGHLMATDRLLSQMPNVALAIHIMVERASQESFWAPYINTLPSTLTTSLYFTPEELQQLKGSPSLGEAILQYRHIARQFAYFYRVFQSLEPDKLPIKEFCYVDYRWAVSVVMTRQNSVPVPSVGRDEQLVALIPLWDMCNHANGQVSSGWDQDEDCLRCYTMADYGTGQEVNIFYGARSNGEFLVHNGFVFPDNAFDRLPVKLGISKNDQLYAMKVEVLARLALMPSRMFFFSNGENPVDPSLWAFCRVFAMEQDVLEKHLSGPNAQEHLRQLRSPNLSPLTAAGEPKACRFLEMRTALLLRSYPTSLQEDEELLATPDALSTHARLCVQQRVCEKKMLEKVRAWAVGQREKTEVALKDGTIGNASEEGDNEEVLEEEEKKGDEGGVEHEEEGKMGDGGLERVEDLVKAAHQLTVADSES